MRLLVTAFDMNGNFDHWRCISQCGACCRLCPEEREEAQAVLSEEQLKEYQSMVGENGWCIHYDTGGQRCQIYEKRPWFCRVSNLCELFQIDPNNVDDFATQCCRQQIRSVYGGRSHVMRRFNREQIDPT